MNSINNVVNKFIHKSHQTDDLCDLEDRFDQLYKKALLLKNNPESSEYLKIKQELKVNRQNRDSILMKE